MTLWFLPHPVKTLKKALLLTNLCIEDDLGLQLSSEKTRITTFKEGFEFLGFFISSNTIGMKDKAIRRFKDKVKEVTQRHRNFEIISYQRVQCHYKGYSKLLHTGFHNIHAAIHTAGSMGKKTDTMHEI